jgi:adenylylsulfate kinase
MNNLFPTDRILRRSDKERLLEQRGIALWLTGLSGSGKTTIAIALEQELNRRGLLTQVLDGDNVRTGINSNLGFSEEERRENIRRIAEVTKLFVGCGVVTICCFVSPTEEIRNIARTIIGKEDLFEIFVNTPIEICEARDVKGLYAKARKGELKDFTGVNAPFESPKHADLELSDSSIEEGVRKIITQIEKRIIIQK